MRLPLRRFILGLGVMAALGAIPAPAQAFPPLVSPFSQDFGDQPVGTQSAGKEFTLRNSCFADPANPNICLDPYPLAPLITVSGPFVVRNNTCPPVMPGDSAFPQTCSFEIVFAPVAAGQAIGIVDVGDPFFGRAGVTGNGLGPPPRTAKSWRKKCKKKSAKRATAAKKPKKKKRCRKTRRRPRAA